VNPRYGLRVGVAIAAGVGLFLAIAPTSWLEELLDVRGADATSFLVRRYAASATAALFVITTAIARRTNPQRAALLGFATWFGVQGVVAILGVGTGTVGGLAWLAVFADPLIAAWFLMWSSRVVNSPHADARSHRSPDPGL
jgi:hypothetical protein